ncbi:MAG: hypothetical protein IJY71_05055 [Clostridia bacterium]|nr:hypothetical protein [Clostridia bacterium]
MKKVISLFLAVLMLVGSLAAFTSCGAKDATIAVYLGDQLYDLDPSMACVNDEAMEVFKLIYEPLFTLNEKGKVKNALASGYRIIENEAENLYQMEITLRETYWSTGHQVTADDVCYAWKRILDPNESHQSQAAPLLYDIKNALAVKQGTVSVDAVGLAANKDILTITFEGKIDYDAFLRNLTSLALVPLREDTVTINNAESWWSKRTSVIATNGPFSVSFYDTELGEFTLQRNVYYNSKEGEAGASVITPALLNAIWPNENFYNYMDDFDGDINAYMKHKVEELITERVIFYLGSMPVDKEIRENTKVTVGNSLSTYSYIFNTNNPLFADARVRQALSMVIDREKIAETLVYAEAATGLVAPGVWNAGNRRVSFRSQGDVLIKTEVDAMDAALELLDEAGVTGGKFTLTVRDTAEDMYIAAYAEERWEELGFQVTVKAETYDTSSWADNATGGRKVQQREGNELTVYDDAIQTAYWEGNFDVIGVDYQMYSTNAFTVLCGFTTDMNGNGVVTSNAQDGNYTYTAKLHCSGFSNAEYDTLMKQALAEKDLEKRATILHQAEALLMEEMPIMPIVFNHSYYASQSISGLHMDYYGLVSFAGARLK